MWNTGAAWWAPGGPACNVVHIQYIYIHSIATGLPDGADKSAVPFKYTSPCSGGRSVILVTRKYATLTSIYTQQATIQGSSAMMKTAVLLY